MNDKAKWKNKLLGVQQLSQMRLNRDPAPLTIMSNNDTKRLQGPLPVVDDYKKLSWILSVVGAAPSKKCRVVGRSSRKSGLIKEHEVILSKNLLKNYA